MITPHISLGLEKMGIKEGDLIIEAGEGTGLSLPLYPNFCRVVGIDLTRKMLGQIKNLGAGNHNKVLIEI